MKTKFRNITSIKVYALIEDTAGGKGELLCPETAHGIAPNNDVKIVPG